MPDLTPQIETAAASPASVTVDGQTVVARPLADLIKADEHLSRKAAANKSRLPIRKVKLRPDGAI